MHCYILKYNESWGILSQFNYKWTKYIKHYRCCAIENKRTTNMFEEQTGVRQGLSVFTIVEQWNNVLI